MDSIGFPSQGDLLKFFYNATGLIPTKGQDILDISIKELREKAKIVVFIERVKTNRKITHLNISFIEDDQIEMSLEGGEKPKSKSRRKPKQTKP